MSNWDEYIKQILSQFPELQKRYNETIKQHYVPVSYLKNFSKDNKMIHAVRFSSIDKSIPIKSVCYKENLYGEKSIVETLFSVLEEDAIIVINKIREHPDNLLNSLDFFTLIEYVLTLYVRNLRNLQQVQTSFSAILEYWSNLRGVGDYTITVDAMSIIILCLESISHNMYRTLAMSSIILLNDTNKEFITCDSPVCVYNPISIKQGITEYSIFSRGSLILITLDPKTCLCWYDPICYRIQQTGRPVRISSEFTIKEINKLITLNAAEFIFLKNDNSEDYNKLIKWRKKLTVDNKVIIENIGNELLIHHYSLNIPIDLNFLKILDYRIGPNEKIGDYIPDELEQITIRDTLEEMKKQKQLRDEIKKEKAINRKKHS